MKITTADMLRIYFLLVTFLTTSWFTAQAQINIGSNEKPKARDGAGLIRKSEVRRMQRCNTVFFYGDKDEANLEALKKVFKNTWSLNKLEFDHIDNFKKYERARNTAFITFEVNPVVKVNTNIGKETEIDCEIYYHLWIPKSRARITYARIDLYPEHEFLKKLIKVPNEEAKKELIYKEGKFFNDSPGLMGLYLKHISKVLSADDNIN
ncbi:MAG: hypothetical protein ACPF9D_11450, partial [Owenweeksia sp.]